MSSQDEEQEVEVQELMHLCPQHQAEQIADKISGISNLYDPLQTSDIKLDNISDDPPPPDINPYLVYLKIMAVKKKTATVIGDIPMRIIKFCAEELCFPLSDLYICAVMFGEYPNIYKEEIVTPAPRCTPH